MADDAKLPTDEEIAQLPRWARVAFAARCARRASELLSRSAEIRSRHLAILLRATETAENSAAFAMRADPAAVELLDFTSTAASDAVRSAVAVISRAVIWAGSEVDGVSQRAITLFLEDVVLAGLTKQYVGDDFATLAEKFRRQNWSDATAVPPSVFGPLDDKRTTNALTLELFVSERQSLPIIGDAVVKLWEVANEYHMARGGGVLTFDEFKQMIPALVPVGPQVGG